MLTMKELQMFGFPVAFDPQKKTLVPLQQGVSFEDYSRKLSQGMFGLLADSGYKTESDPYYDFYKAIGRDSERQAFANVDLRYDSTVIMAGSAGDEYKKTAGHFHCEVPGKGMSYPEYYQVIKGRALFVMQKVKNFHTEDVMVVEDAILAEAGAGESVVIPPEYGHCTVNISDETMVFVNLVSCNSQNYYDSVKGSHGMCCYVKKDGAGYHIEKNPAYRFACDPKLVAAGESEALGIYKNTPVYTQFLKDPAKYAYLNMPETRVSDYLHAFAPK